MKKKQSAREKKHRAWLRKDDTGRVALAVGDFLTARGWTVVMTTGAEVEEDLTARGGFTSRSYRFVLKFVGAPPPTAREGA